MIDIDAHGVLDDRFVRDCKSAIRRAPTTEPIRLNIASPGGRMDVGVTAYNLLRSAPQEIHARLEGDAFSAATLLVCAADTCDMPANALMMIHEPHVAHVAGTIDECEKTLRYLLATRNQAVQIYHDRTALPAEHLVEMLRAETYLTAEEALAIGLATNVCGPSSQIQNLAPDAYCARNKARLAEMLGKRHLVRDVSKILCSIRGEDDH